MAMVLGDGSSIPISFPCRDDGVAWVSALVLSVRFNLELTSMWVKEELFDFEGVEIVSIVMQMKLKDERGDVWRFTLGKYHAFGTPNAVRSMSIDILTPRSITSSIPMSHGTCVKIEPSDHSYIDLTESSDDDTILVSETTRKLSPIPKMHDDIDVVMN